MFKRKTLIRINYKSGIQEQFWVWDLTIKDGNWTWKPVDPEGFKPLFLNIDEVESVWIVKRRLTLKFTEPE